MEIFDINNNISGLKWEIENPKAFVVIGHGMAEHASRYDYIAKLLNKDNYSVYAINQIGHGIPVVGKKGHWEKGDFEKCVDNMEELVKYLKDKNPGKKIFIIAHSMGSFILQEYISKYGNSVNGVVLSGTNGPSTLAKAGNFVANVVFALADNTKPNKFLNKLSFGSYNSAFKPNKTEFDWLSRDEEQVKKYIEDDDCGFVCTTGFFKEFTSALANLHSLDKIKRIPLNLPILLISGEKDPVGENGKGVMKLYSLYKDNDLKNIDIKLYPNARHEIFNEINKNEVISDVIKWLNKN
ncbi:MAG: lysophospholipase [Bacilli bacterium]|nr:lysophospholipase [Bacilli bacterium]